MFSSDNIYLVIKLSIDKKLLRHYIIISSPPPPHDLYCGGCSSPNWPNWRLSPVGKGRCPWDLHHYYHVNIFIIIKITFRVIIIFTKGWGKSSWDSPSLISCHLIIIAFLCILQRSIIVG